jgi:hypothetical protein
MHASRLANLLALSLSFKLLTSSFTESLVNMLQKNPESKNLRIGRAH